MNDFAILVTRGIADDLNTLSMVPIITAGATGLHIDNQQVQEVYHLRSRDLVVIVGELDLFVLKTEEWSSQV